MAGRSRRIGVGSPSAISMPGAVWPWRPCWRSPSVAACAWRGAGWCRTRSGAVVDNLLIFWRDQPEAERKLRQMYMGCEILEQKNVASGPSRSGPVSYEDVVDLISGR